MAMGQLMDWQSLAVVAVFVLAGLVKGVTGMGLPTVAMSLLALWMAPVQAAALLVLPSLATNLAQCRGAHFRYLCRLLWPAWLALMIVTVWAPDARAWPPAISPQRLLGAVLLAYGAWGLWRPALPPLLAHRSWHGLLVGAATGLVTAATAVFVLPLVPYLQWLRLPKDVMVQALGLSFTLATLALAARLHAQEVAVPLSGALLPALGAAFAGLWLGGRLRTKLAAAGFQRALFVMFVLLGTVSLWRS